MNNRLAFFAAILAMGTNWGLSAPPIRSPGTQSDFIVMIVEVDNAAVRRSDNIKSAVGALLVESANVTLSSPKVYYAPVIRIVSPRQESKSLGAGPRLTLLLRLHKAGNRNLLSLIGRKRALSVISWGSPPPFYAPQSKDYPISDLDGE